MQIPVSIHLFLTVPLIFAQSLPTTPPFPRGPTTHITRNRSTLYLDGKPWTASGANVYWLGLDENIAPPKYPLPDPFYAPLNASYPSKARISEIFATLHTLGARTVRSHTLGVSVGNPLSVMPRLGEVNKDERVWDSMDWAVYEAGRWGIRVIVPLTDNYDYYHGGKFTFLRWRGIDVKSSDPRVHEFYTNRTIIDDFKNYIHIILTHRNPYTNQTYSTDPTILAYETGNELTTSPPLPPKSPSTSSTRNISIPAPWTLEITSYIKSLAPQKLTIDGTYGINEKALDIESVDGYSDHFYPLDVKKLREGVEKVGGKGKIYFAGEYTWTPGSKGDGLGEFLGWVEGRQNGSGSEAVVVGDHLWSLFGRNPPDCSTWVDHNDGLTLHYNNPKTPSSYTTQIAKIRQHLFKMQGIAVDDKVNASSLPAVPCPVVAVVE